MNFTILRFETLDSTNSEAARQAKLGADEGLCVIAQQQTAGRGRHGRSWISEKDAGLYFSVVLRPKIDMRFLPLITLMTGVAVYDTLKEFDLKPDIKWVNDVLVGEKKISGILAETVETQNGLAVIVGIGINLTSHNFPDEIADTATSIQAEIKRSVAADDIAEMLTHYVSYFYNILLGDNGPQEVLNAWQKRSSYFSGLAVRVKMENVDIQGVTEGLEETGALRVKTADGTVKIIQAGEVERLRKAEITSGISEK